MTSTTLVVRAKNLLTSVYAGPSVHGNNYLCSVLEARDLVKEISFFPRDQVDVTAVFPYSAWAQSLNLDILRVSI